MIPSCATNFLNCPIFSENGSRAVKFRQVMAHHGHQSLCNFDVSLITTRKEKSSIFTKFDLSFLKLYFKLKFFKTYHFCHLSAIFDPPYFIATWVSRLAVWLIMQSCTFLKFLSAVTEFQELSLIHVADK